MKAPIRLLLVEDYEEDAYFLLRRLKRDGYEISCERVDKAEGLAAALESGQWDVVVSDFAMPTFDALDALRLVREKDPDLPFIIVSGVIGEENAVKVMKAGAHDYVSKDGLARLGAAIEREMREAENRRARKRSEKALKQAEEKYRSIFENAVDGIYQTTVDGELTLANPAMARILGYSTPEEFLSSVRNVEDTYVEPARRMEFARLVEQRGTVSGFEVELYHKSGTRVWVSVAACLLQSAGGEIIGYQGIVEDITEHKKAQEALLESEERFRTLVQNATDITTILEKDGTIRYKSPASERIVGYQPEELVGRRAFDYIHPNDRERFLSVTKEVLRSPGVPLTLEFRFRHANGSWCHLEAVVNNLLEDPSMRGIVINSRDVTESKRAKKALRQSEDLYRAVIEQATENIFLVDAETKRIVAANAALYRSLDYDEEELRRLTLYDIVAHDKESIDWHVQRILETRQHFIGEREYRRKDGSLVNVEVSASTLVHEGRDTLCIVAHDVTERKQTEESLRRSLDVLLALREAGQVLGSTLELEEIGSRLLEIMRGVSGLTAAVISVEDEPGQLSIWRAAGLDGLWRRARYAPEAEAARRAVLETEEHQMFRLWRPSPETGHLVGLCLPLRVREHTSGVLEAYGPEALEEEDAVEILRSLANQAASALDNARLYGELAEREKRLEDLIGKIFVAQEEERRRVAYEVHDGLAQMAAAAHQHLQTFARVHSADPGKGREILDRALDLVQRTVGEARRVIANLRPTALDDFGLKVALRLEVEALRENGWLISYEGSVEDHERLPSTVETAIFRVAQEALTNATKHANSERRIHLSLDHLGEKIRLSVRDWGQGFDPAQSLTRDGPGERVGISSMRERVAMLGGEFQLYSRPGTGTLIQADVPLPDKGKADRERDDVE